MPTVPHAQAAVAAPPIDPQLQRLGDDVVATFRAAALKAIASQADPGRATLAEDPESIEHTMLALYQRVPTGVQARVAERVAATLDASDRPAIDLRSIRSIESQIVLRTNLTTLEQTLGLARTLKPAKPGTGLVEMAAQSAIAAKRDQAEFLGNAQSDVTTAPDGKGHFRHYEHGSIYWTAKTGAHEVHGAIREKWQSLGWERGALGYPTSDETATPDGRGRFNHFQGGSIYWTSESGAHEVHGAIRQKWAELGWETGYLGYPTSDETAAPDTVGRYNHFQGGSIYWTPARGAFAVHKEVRDVWAGQRYELGELGYPIEDTQIANPKRQRFEGGAIENREIKKPKTTVQLRLHAVSLVDETDSENPFDKEAGADEMSMGGAVIDGSGATRAVERFWVADFNEGGLVHKPFDPPKVLYTFGLSDSPGWPKTYVSTLLLAEIDDGDFDKALRELLQKIREYVIEQAKKAGPLIGAAFGAGVGAAAGIIGAAIGAVIGYVVGELFDWFDGLFEDNILSPAVFNVTVHDVWAFADSNADTRTAKGHGGEYTIRADYALRS